MLRSSEGHAKNILFFDCALNCQLSCSFIQLHNALACVGLPCNFSCLDQMELLRVDHIDEQHPRKRYIQLMIGCWWNSEDKIR